MFSPRHQKIERSAKDYFKAQLSRDDYYSSGRRVMGAWMGEGCHMLGLPTSGNVSQLHFTRLCDNRHPLENTKLTPRMNKSGNRRIFYDFVASAPKSVSIMALVMGDEELKKAHDLAASYAFKELEDFAEVRCGRKGSKERFRRTSNVVAAVFQHNTSRANDPQLHTHHVVFNASYDANEERWKALSAFSQYKGLRYLTAVYRQKLKEILKELGYEVIPFKGGRDSDRPDPTRFEIKGVPREVIFLYSRRSQQLDGLIEQWKEDRRKAGEDEREPNNNEVSALLRRHRPRKSEKSDLEISIEQANLLTSEQRNVLEEVRNAALRKREVPKDPTTHTALPQAVTSDSPTAMVAEWTPKEEIDAARVLAHVEKHVFERQSVAFEGELRYEAMCWSNGQINMRAFDALLRKSRSLFIKQGRVTTWTTVEKELTLEGFVRRGAGTATPIALTEGHLKGLNKDQSEAAKFVLQSKDRVTGFKGLAGVGKTRTIMAIVDAIGHDRIFTCAPTREGVKALSGVKAGKVGTMRHLLKNPKRYPGIRNGVIILDEAGLVGLDDMTLMVSLAQRYNAKLILSGDIGQHVGVPWGDALRQLERSKHYRYKTIKEILRQKNPVYKKIVELAAEEKPIEAAEELEKLGCLTECPNPHRKAANAYLRARRKGIEALVVAPGKKDRQEVTKLIRAGLKKTLGPEVETKRFVSLNWTEEKKKDRSFYKRAMSIYCPVKTGCFEAHERLEVIAAHSKAIVVRRPNGSSAEFNPETLADFEVGRMENFKLAPGEQIMLKENRGIGSGGPEFWNGEVVTIKAVDSKTKSVVLEDERILPPGYCKYRYAYAFTSPSVQGKTTKDVIVVATAQSGRAVNMNQFYVSISRGEHTCQVFTEDLEHFKERISESSHRTFGMELLSKEQLQAARKLALANLNRFLTERIRRFRENTEPSIDL